MVSMRVFLAAALLLVWVGCEAGPATPGRPGSPAEAGPLVASAQEQYLAGNYLTASDLFAQAWRADGESFEAAEGLVRSSEAMGEVGTLAQQLWSEARSQPPTATREYATGLTQMLMAKFEVAQRHLNAALELAPGSPWVFYARGELFRAVGADEAARNDFQAVLHREREHGAALAALAILAFRHDHDEDEATRLLLEAVKHFRPLERSQQIAAHVFLGRLYARHRDHTAALEQFHSARRLDPATTYSLVNLGSFLARIGRTQEAEREWDATLRELGADSPTGLDILRTRRERAGDLIDLTHVLGAAPSADYEALIGHVGSPRRLPSLLVDDVLRPYIPPARDVLIDAGEDLDADGQRERLVVDAEQSDAAFPDQFLIRNAVLRLFSVDRTEPYVFPTEFDHFYKLLVRDLDGDGSKEILLAGFRGTNRLTVAVLARGGRGYSPVLMVEVRCSTPWAGCLVTDLDGDGSREMLFISGEDGWVDIYRWRNSQAKPRANAKFPQFYVAFLRRWGSASSTVLSERPGLAEKIKEARSYRSQ